MKNNLAIFENFKIRRHWNEKKEKWYFSVVDIVQILTQQPDFQAARKYWNKLSERLKKESSQVVTKCHRLKLEAADGKKYLTDVADVSDLPPRRWNRYATSGFRPPQTHHLPSQ